MGSSNSLDSGCRDVGYLSSHEVKDDDVEQLKVAMDRGELTDEPCVDPGVCERKYHDEDCVPAISDYMGSYGGCPTIHGAGDDVFKDNKLSAVTCQEPSYFSDLSPVIDVYDTTMVTESGVGEQKQSSFLDYRRLSNNDHGQLLVGPDQNIKMKTTTVDDTTMTTTREEEENLICMTTENTTTTINTSLSENTKKSEAEMRTSLQKLRENILGKSITQGESLRTLNGTVCPKTCRMEDILTKKLSPNQIVHWDSLRFWI